MPRGTEEGTTKEKTMASPVVLSYDELKTLVAFAERGAKQGILKITEHLQPFIDRPELYQRFVRWAEAGMPDFPVEQPAPAQVPVPVFQDPDGHRAARDIMGEKNFHGIAAAQRRFGSYSEAAFERRQKIRLFDEKANTFLSEEDTLAVLEQHKTTHILVATHENHTRNCFALKCDIHKFFASVDHAILLKLLFSRIEDERVMDLLCEIIGSFSASEKISVQQKRDSHW